MVELESLKQTVDRLTARLWTRSSGRRTWAVRIAGGGPLCHFNATTVWAGGRPQLLLVLRNRNGESMACQGGMFHGTQRRVGDGTVRPWWAGALALPRIPWAPCHLPVAHWPLPGCGYVPWGSVQFGHNAHGGCCSSRRRSNLGQWPDAFGAYTRSCERTMVLSCPGGLVCCLGIALDPLDILDRNIYQVRPRHRIAALLPSAAAACPILAACLLWLPDVSLSLPGGSAAACVARLPAPAGLLPGAAAWCPRAMSGGLWAVSTWIQSPSAAGNPPAAARSQSATRHPGAYARSVERAGAWLLPACKARICLALGLDMETLEEGKNASQIWGPLMRRRSCG